MIKRDSRGARDKYRSLSEEKKKLKDRIWKKQIPQCVRRKKQRLKEYKKKLSRG